MNWTARQRVFFVIVIMTLACLASASVAITLLYQAAFEEERTRLAEITHTQARLMEAVARFDQQYSEQDHPEGSASATISQIIDAHKYNDGFGETGEMTLARQEGDQIVWILNHRHFDLDQPKPLPLSGELAKPTSLALSGKSGTIEARDYRGEIVLAAYEPVALLKLGLVSKIDLQEIRAPFLQAGIVTGIAGISIIALGGFLLFRISHPIIKRLEESEAYTRAIVTHAGEGIVTADETGTIETFNSTAERIFLYPAREVIGKKLGALMPKPHNEHYQEYIDSYLRTGEQHIPGTRREVTAQRRDGTTFPLSLAVTEVTFSQHRLFIGLVHELTEEKMAERRLRAQYEVARILAKQTTIDQAAPEILRAVCESLGWQLGVLWQVDTQENALQCVELWCSAPDQFTEFVATTKGTTFIKGQGLPGRVWNTSEAVWIPDVVKDTNFPRANIAAKENLHAAFAFPIQLGVEVYGVMEFFSFHIHEPDDALLQQMQSVGSQIGQFIDRTKAQKEIEVLAKFPEENPNPVLRVLRDGTVSYHNKAATGFLSALESEKDQQLLSQWHTLIQNAFSHGSVQEQELVCHGRFFSLTMAVINRTDYMNVYALDITDRKKAEEYLRNRDEQRRQMQKLESIGTLAGGIAHDFNNILAALLGFTELAIAKAKTTPEAVAVYLQEVLQAGQRAKNLVQQILTFSRQGDAGKKPIQLQTIVEEALKLLRASLPSTIAVHQDLESAAGPVFADPTQIHQVVMNLGTNAEHAMRGKGGILHVTLNKVTVEKAKTTELPGLTAGPYVRFTMTDSGQGIPPEILSRIFDPFFTTKGAGEGTGMGLSVTHGIVTDHGGVILVDSEPGKGTTVVVYFPLTVESLEEPPLNSPEIPRGEGTVLFVDDEASIVESGKTMLETLGYHVEAYTNSREALTAFRQAPQAIDVVITDQTMPECTGAELAKEILQIRPSIPLILCTGFSHIMNEEKAHSIGISVFLSKPYHIHELAQAVQHAFNKIDYHRTNPLSS